jgi:hypothetical protein
MYVAACVLDFPFSFLINFSAENDGELLDQQAIIHTRLTINSSQTKHATNNQPPCHDQTQCASKFARPAPAASFSASGLATSAETIRFFTESLKGSGICKTNFDCVNENTQTSDASFFSHGPTLNTLPSLFDDAPRVPLVTDEEWSQITP